MAGPILSDPFDPPYPSFEILFNSFSVLNTYIIYVFSTVFSTYIVFIEYFEENNYEIRSL